MDKLLQWYDDNARKLPWRENKDPYRIWLSEIMLQQTRVETVIDYYLAWLQVFPTIASVAKASEDQVLKQWQGLGYYSRARNFHRAAKIIVDQNHSNFPETTNEWRKLPGVGEYTAAAITSIAFNKVIPVFDGNVIRVMTRVCGFEQNPNEKTIQQQMLEKSVFWISQTRPGDYNQAMMELGATICLPNSKPLCQSCPLSSDCKISGTDLWRKIPFKKEKTIRKIEDRSVFIIYHQHRILLNKRPVEGLLGNLWELPSIEGHITTQQVEDWIHEHNYIPISIIQGEKVFKHVFTHLEWIMKVWFIEVGLNEQLTFEHWLEVGDSESVYAIPTAFRGILDWLNDFVNKTE